jgi:hypothetical protein
MEDDMVNLSSPDSKRKLIPYYISPDDNKIYQWQISNQDSFVKKFGTFIQYFFGIYEKPPGKPTT